MRCTAAAGAVLLAASLLRFASTARVAEPVRDEPLPPIRRVLLDPSLLPPEVHKNQDLQAMPRAEFEAALSRAQRVAAARRDPPRILEARYHASLDDGHLAGTTEWRIHNPHEVVGVLWLDQWNLALRPEPTLDGARLVLGTLAGRRLGAVVPPGTHTARFAWSARGEPRPEGLFFDLLTPPAPLAVLDLEVPAAFQVAVAGRPAPSPAAAAMPDRLRWRIAFGQEAAAAEPESLRLELRPRHDPGKPTAILSRQDAQYQFSAGGVEARFQLALDTYHGPISEARLLWETALEPAEVTLRQQPVTWQWHTEGSHRYLLLRFTEPLQGRATLDLRCRPAEVPMGGAFSFAVPRLSEGLSGPATISVYSAADLILTDWNFGDYPPTGSQRVERDRRTGAFRPISAQGSEKDHWEEVVLNREGLGPARPASARIGSRDADVTVKQTLWWHIGSEDTRLTARMHWHVHSGRLFQLVTELPEAWSVESVVVPPREPVARFDIESHAGRSLLIVELPAAVEPNRPEDADRPIEVLIHLRRTIPETPAGRRRWSVPRVTPRGVRALETELAITLERVMRGDGRSVPSYRATPHGLGARRLATPAGPQPLWASRALDYFFVSHGQGPDGFLEIEPLTPLAHSRCITDLTLDGADPTRTHSVDIQPLAGSVREVTVAFSDHPGPLRWQVVSGTNELAEPPARDVDPREPAFPHGQLWRIRFRHPLTGPVRLRAEASPPVSLPWVIPGGPFPTMMLLIVDRPSGDSAIPLLRSVDPGTADDLVQVRLSEGRRIELMAQGLLPTEPEGSDNPSATPVWRAFRIGSGPAALKFRPSAPAPASPSEPIFVEAVWSRLVDSTGSGYGHYACWLRSSGDIAPVLRLPRGAELCAVHRNGLSLPQPDCRDGRLVLPTRTGPTRYDITYQEKGTRWPLGVRWTGEAPTWEAPVQVVSFRALLCAPAGLVPLIPSSHRPLLGVSASARRDDWLSRSRLRETAERTGAWWSEASSGWQLRMQAALDRAWVAYRQRHPAGGERLGQAFVQLAREFPEDRLRFVVDEAAWFETEASFTEPLVVTGDRSPWETGQVAVIPCRAGFVLTTPRQARDWRFSGADEAERVLGSAVADAVTHGHDPSGRFRSLTASLRLGLPGGFASVNRTPGLPEGLGTEGVWWEIVEPTAAQAPVWLVRQDAAAALGIVLALAALALGALLRRRSRGRLVFSVLGLLSTGTAALWVPDALRALAVGPLVAVGMLAGYWYLRRAWEPLAGWKLPSFRPIRAAVLLVCLGWTASFAVADPPEGAPVPPSTVYLLPGPPGKVDQHTALVPRALWSRLQAQARDQAIELPDYVVVEAAYEGRLEDAGAKLDAVYHVEVLRATKEAPAQVRLPVGPARLRDALLDSLPVPAVALRPGPGYQVEVAEPGRHSVRLSLEVPLREQPGERELRCGLPCAAASRLTLQLPDGAWAAHVLGNDGGQWVRGDAGLLRLDADLGWIVDAATPELRARWRTDRPDTAQVRVQEAYRWHLRPQEITLGAALQYEVVRGAVPGVRVQLPPGVEVRSVEVRGDARDGVAASPPPRLRDWRVEGGPWSRVLVLEFRLPVQQRFRVLLDLPIHLAATGTPPELTVAEHLIAGISGRGIAPGLSLAAAELQQLVSGTRAVLLRFPRPIAVERIGGVFDYRLTQLVGRPISDSEPALAAPTLVPAETFWPPEPGLIGRVRGYRFAGSDPPHLEFAVAHSPPQVRGHQELTLHIESEEVALRAKAELAVESGRLVHLDWQLPPGLEVATLDGDDLLRWSQRGTTLHVWFKRAIGAEQQTELTLTAWLKPHVTGERTSRLSVPRLQLSGVRVQTTRLRLVPKEVTIRLDQLVGLTEHGGDGAPVPPGTAVLSATGADYGGNLLIQSAPPVLGTSEPIPTASVPARAGPGEIAGVRVFLADYRTRLSTGGPATHDATYKVSHPPGATFALRMPDESVLLDVQVDGKPIVPDLMPGSVALVPLPAGSGWCAVDVRWTHLDWEPGGKRVGLTPPLPLHAGEFAALWTLNLPIHYSASAVKERGGIQGQTGPIAAARQAIRRAEAQLRLVRALVDRPGMAAEASLRSAVEEFLRFLHEAEERLQAAPQSDSQIAAQLEALRQRLLETFRAPRWDRFRAWLQSAEHRQSVPATRTAASLDSALLTVVSLGRVGGPAGLPIYYAFSDQPAEISAPLVSAARDGRRRLATLTALFGAIAVAVLAGARFPAVVRIAFAVWPEVLISAGFVAWFWWELGGPLGFWVLVAASITRLMLTTVILFRWAREASAASNVGQV